MAWFDHVQPLCKATDFQEISKSAFGLRTFDMFIRLDRIAVRNRTSVVSCVMPHIQLVDYETSAEIAFTHSLVLQSVSS
mgnify:CR=1 FL=1